MLNTIYLHIGLDKTGSKAIQFACHQNRSSLLDLGILYPDGIAHAEFASYFYTNPKEYTFNKISNRNERELSIIQVEDAAYIARLEQQIQELNFKTLIFSWEGFPGLQLDVLQKMKMYFDRISEQTKVLLYCRNPISYAISAVSQRAKGGNALWNPPPIHDFKSICENFSSVFGFDNILVRKYLKDDLKGWDVKKDFFTQIGLDDIEIGNLNLTPALINEALSAEAILIAEELRKIDLTKNFKKRYEKILTAIKGTRYCLSPEQLTDIIDGASPQLAYLHSLFGMEFDLNSKMKNEISTSKIGSNFIQSLAKIFSEKLLSEKLGELLVINSISSIEKNCVVDLDVVVLNLSERTLISEAIYPICLSYHWLLLTGETLITDGLRTSLPIGGISPNQMIYTKMQIQAPNEVGTFVLILTMVEEGITWLEDIGFKTARLEIKITDF